MTAIMMAVLGVVAIRLYYLQVIRSSEMEELADRNRIRMRRMPAPRGLVYDRRHRPLVDTHPTFNAIMVPEDSPNISETIEKLENLLGSDGAADKLAAAEEMGRPPYEPVLMQERLDWSQIVALETHQLELPGVSLEVVPGRHYLYGSLAAHLLGYVGEVDRNDLLKQAGYYSGDEIGKFGLERGWEPFLRGEAGGQQIEVDSVGRRLRILKEIPDHPGKSVILTIDLDIQQAAENAMKGHNGALVALDPNNGDILAMVSHPDFDSDVFGVGVKPAEWRKLMTDTDHPLQDRVIQGIYPPGSTFKVVDTVAGMQEHTLTKQTAYSCAGGMWFGGREYHCWRKHGHGTIQLERAIVSSCDVYFYNVGQHLGIDKLAHWANLFGLGEKSGVALDNEKTGTMPSSAWKQRRYHDRWYPAETLSVAIGQGYVAATPLQMANVAAVVANGGIRYRPQFVKEVEALDGHVERSYPPEIAARVNADSEVFDFVRDAMAGVVNSPGGTASKAKLPDIIVAGKTGTAQVVGDQRAGIESGEDESKIPEKYRDNGWFIAFAPKDHPQIAVACVIEHGGHGGSSAAPVVHDVLKRFFELNPVNPAASPDVTNVEAGAAVAQR
ncbi:MAG TPA: penicillin-binding protein 2 [Candidatus Binataceae bacterium]|nr:penicillin-binding protein 2 [Candidatus Binataceae bacterium]